MDWSFWVSDLNVVTRTLRFIKAPRVGGRSGAVFVGSGAASAAATLKAARSAMWKSRKTPPPLNWEPSDILREMIVSGAERTVGGPIQVVKVYSHLSVMPYAVFWPSRATGRVTLFGRPLLDYEKTQRLALDPETHKIYKLWDYLEVPTLKKR